MGLAIGDAFGWPVEGMSAAQIRTRFGQLRDLSQGREILETITANGPQSVDNAQRILQHWQPPGFYSDDTQQALLVIDSLLACRGADADDFARRALQASFPRTADVPLGVHRGYGPGFAQALENLNAGTPAKQAGVASAGNGAAMRIAPVGIYFAGNNQKIIHAAVEISLVTHRDPRGLSSAAALALAVGEAACSKPPYRADDLLEKLLPNVRQAEQYIKTTLPDQPPQHYHQFSDALAALADLIHTSPKHALTQIAENAAKATDSKNITATHPFVLASVVTSFWYFLHHIESIEEAICQAVNSGGDSDTIGAMTGALAGALHGSSAIPSQWPHTLHNHRQVILRAEALAGKSESLNHIADFQQMEMKLTAQYIAARRHALQPNRHTRL